MGPGANPSWACSAARRAMCRRLSFEAPPLFDRARAPAALRLAFAFWRRGATFSAGRATWVVARPNPSADDARHQRPHESTSTGTSRRSLGTPPRGVPPLARSLGPRRLRIRPVTDPIASRRGPPSKSMAGRAQAQAHVAIGGSDRGEQHLSPRTRRRGSPRSSRTRRSGRTLGGAVEEDHGRIGRRARWGGAPLARALRPVGALSCRSYFGSARFPRS